MTRISKDPEERKSEIIDAAEELFLTKGYEQTAVSDIVKKVGVAQGLFYYYFKCKDEILNAISERMLSFLLKGVRSIVKDPNINAVKKIDLIIEEMFNVLGLGKKGMFKLINHVHKEENNVMHQKMAVKFTKQSIPLLSNIVIQGVEEGVFNTKYPFEVTEILVTWASQLHTNIKFPITDINAFEVKAKALEDIVERILGAKSGSLDFVKYTKLLNNP